MEKPDLWKKEMIKETMKVLMDILWVMSYRLQLYRGNADPTISHPSPVYKYTKNIY